VSATGKTASPRLALANRQSRRLFSPESRAIRKLTHYHLPAYLDEMTFRFNRRKNANLFLDTLRHMVTSPVLTFERLTA